MDLPKLSTVKIIDSFRLSHNTNYSSNCVFPYFPIERVDASHQLLATYLVTDLLRLGHSCKRAFSDRVLAILETSCSQKQK